MRFPSTAPLWLALVHIGLWSLWLLWMRDALAASAGSPQLEFHWWFWLSHASLERAFQLLKVTHLLVVAWLWSSSRAPGIGTRARLACLAAALLTALLLIATRTLFLLRPALELIQVHP